MSADSLATRLIQQAVSSLLASVKAEQKLGVRSRALPTEDQDGLAATVAGVRAALDELGEPDALAVVGSWVEGAAALSQDGVVVCTPPEAAARATEERGREGGPGTGVPWPLVYVCEVDVAGASGLQMLSELTAWHLLEAAAEQHSDAELPVVHRCVDDYCPRGVREVLEARGYRSIAAYVARARDGEHLEALPLLGLVPASLRRTSGVMRPHVRWTQQLQRLVGSKPENKIASAAQRLREARDSVDAAWRARCAEVLRQAHAVPAGGTDRQALDWALGMARSAGALTECRDEDLVGLSKALIDRLLKGAGVVPARSPGDPPPPPPPGDLEVHRVLTESRLLGVRPPAAGAAGSSQERVLRTESDVLAALSSWPADPEGLPLVTPLDADNDDDEPLAGALRARLRRPDDEGFTLEVREDGWCWAAWQLVLGRCGAALAAEAPVVTLVGGEAVTRLVSNTLSSGTVEPSKVEQVGVLTQLEGLAGHPAVQAAAREYRTARLALASGAAALAGQVAGPGGAASDDVLVAGLRLLRRLPLLTCARLRAEVGACLVAYEALVDLVQGDAYEALRSSGQLHGVLMMDTVVAFDSRSRGFQALQLLPLHPLALSTWLRRLDTVDASASISSAFKVKLGLEQPVLLGATASPLVYSLSQRVPPSDAAVLQATAWLVDGVFGVLSHGRPGLTGALHLQLVDVPSLQLAARCVDEVVKRVRDLRVEEDAHSSPHLHLLVSLAELRSGSCPWTRSPACVEELAAALGESAGSVLGVGGRSDLSLELRLERADSDAAGTPFLPLVHGRVECRSGVRGPHVAWKPSGSAARAQYKVDKTTGDIIRVASPEEAGVGSWRALTKRVGMSAETDVYYESHALSDHQAALVAAVAARGGWPLPHERAGDLLAFTQLQHDSVAVVCGRALSSAIADRAVAAFGSGLAELMPAPAEDLATLQRACRYFLDDGRAAPLQLLRGRGGSKMVERMSRARALVLDRDDPAVLVLSLDSGRGLALGRRLRDAFGTASRTDLLRLTAELDPHGRVIGLRRLELVELKAGTQARSAETEAGRRTLSSQARLMAARLRAAAGQTDLVLFDLQETLRALCWLGAGAFRLAHTWSPALEQLDAWLDGKRALEVQATLWACPPELGADRSGRDTLPELAPETGEEVEGSSETLEWRVIRASEPEPERASPEEAGEEHGSEATDEPAAGADADGADTNGAPPVASAVTEAAAVPGGDVPEAAAPAPAPRAPAAEAPLGSTAPVRPSVVLGQTPGRGLPVAWEPFGGARRLTNAHMVIVGGSGSGKTQALKSLTSSLSDQGVALVMLDFKDDYVAPSFRERIGASLHDALRGLSVNPLALTPDPLDGMLDPMVHIYAVAGVLEQVFGLGAQQRAHLVRALQGTYEEAGIPLRAHLPEPERAWPPFRSLLPHLEATGDATLVNRLRALFDLGVFEGASGSVDDLLRSSTVLRLTKLPSETDKKAVGALLLQSLYNALIRQGHAEGLRVAIVIDEAHRVANLAPVELLLKEARAFGAAVFLSSQEPGDFHDSLVANAGSHLVLQVTEARAARDAARLAVGSARSADAAERVRRLQTFHALFRNNHHPDAVEVRVTPFFERETE